MKSAPVCVEARRCSDWSGLAAAAGRVAGGDDSVGALGTLATAAGAAGLRSLALAAVDRMSAAGADPARLAGARARLMALPDERVDAEERLVRVAMAVAMLAERGVDLLSAFRGWYESAPIVAEVDGEVIARADDAGAVHRVGSAIDAVRRGLIAVEHDTSGPGVASGPLVVGCESETIVLRAVAEATAEAAVGYTPRLIAVARRAEDFFDALLADPDPVGLVSMRRVTFVLGDDAAERLEADHLGSIGREAPKGYISSPAGESLGHQLMPALARVAKAQTAELAKLSASLIHGQQDPGRFAERYRDAGARLRVMLMSCRHSTFIRHWADDLAGALRRLGHDMLVHEEPGDHDRLTSISTMQAFDRYSPDLVVSPNHPRDRSLLPEVPFVCWVQDRMPHLFDRAVGQAQGPLDLLVGHFHPSLFELWGWQPGRGLYLPIPASPEKFFRSPGPTSFDRDIVYVSHQSEHPDAFHDRFLGLVGDDEVMRRAVELCRTRINDRVRNGRDRRSRGGELTFRPEPTIPDDCLREVAGADVDPRAIDHLRTMYAAPMAERVIRHAALERVAAQAERLGLRFELFGNGWEDHPTLSGNARGPVPHGDALRQIYGGSRLSLHLSAHTNAHQRVAECALSGGLVLRQGPSVDAWWHMVGVFQWLIRETKPEHTEADGSAWHMLPADQGAGLPGWVRRLRLMRPRRRVEHGPIAFRITPERRESVLAKPHVDVSLFPDQVFDSADQTLFTTWADLDRMIERGCRDDAWRAARAEEQRESAERYLTTDAIASRMMAFVREHVLARSRQEAA
ncbi:MAG: hypothetical protein AAGI17_02510 [Planctomycetota bacterium]